MEHSSQNGFRRPRLCAGVFHKHVYETETLGGRTVIRTIRLGGRRQRQLIVRGTQQSALWLDDPFGEIPFPYLQRFDLSFEVRPAPQHLLLLGGAGYAWPRHVLTNRPDITLDVVEIDAAMNDIARRWFFLDELERRHGATGDGRLRLFVEDGASFLAERAKTTGPYDAIYNDTFIASEPAHSLMDAQAAALVHARLTPQGLYLTNVISALMGPDAFPLESVVSALTTQFTHVSVIPCEVGHPKTARNTIIIATDRAHDFPGTWMTYAG